MPRPILIILASQRSGTNALRSVINTHPNISTEMGEVFEESPRSPSPYPTFFDFFTSRVQENVELAMPNRRRDVFVDFLGCIPTLTGKPINVIDVKYNSTHHLDGFWREPRDAPAFFEFIRDRDIPVVHLVRGNMLKTIISELRAEALNQYTVSYGDQVNRRPVHIELIDVIHRLHRIEQSIGFARSELSLHPSAVELTYEEVFRVNEPIVPGEPRPLDMNCLEKIAGLVGQTSEFHSVPMYQKLTDDRLEAAVENWREIKAALLDTPYRRFTE